MSLTIPAQDHGRIRVFHIVPPGPIGILDKTPEALQDALGTDQLNPDFLDAFDTQALGDMTIPDYLRRGYDVEPDPADHAMLGDLEGLILLVMSRATDGQEITLTPGTGVTHVTTCGDGAQLNVSDPLAAKTAEGVLGDPAPKPRSDAATGGRVALVALIVMFALVGVMVWIGG